MPIAYTVDRENRIVFASPYGTLTKNDMFRYQVEVWRDPGVAGYNECIDMTGVKDLEGGSSDDMMALAEFSASMDNRGNPSKLAIIAEQDLFFGLGRMYEAYRAMQRIVTKRVRVFRTREEAMEWLKSDAADKEPGSQPGSSF
jgi:hypothetical protein